MDLAAKALKGEEGCPKTPEMGERRKQVVRSRRVQDCFLGLENRQAPPSPEDSVPVITPPEQSTEFSGSGSTSVIAWPSVSPKKGGIARAASFAERIWNRAGTKSGASALSVNEIKDCIAAEALNEPLPTDTDYKSARFNYLDSCPIFVLARKYGTGPLSDDSPKISELSPPGQVFGSPTSFDATEVLSAAMSLPNPHSGDILFSMPFRHLSLRALIFLNGTKLSDLFHGRRWTWSVGDDVKDEADDHDAGSAAFLVHRSENACVS
ncbi:hypothetical protein AMATHDRAFT_9821 [Amanita thiersii Skay4041]|uniref:Uncharacterized protein n=1 Tax=Amanita thiersii Skay4041 TaxID=703135 RepID=A0A2A9NBV5_9AGAR|nr:hypothetical protein AMATHDRAFT_9821 [Amanita thiersii Skay4041]